MSARVVIPGLQAPAILVDADYEASVSDASLNVVTPGVLVTLPPNPVVGATTLEILPSARCRLSGGDTPLTPTDPLVIPAGRAFSAAFTETGWQLLGAGGGVDVQTTAGTLSLLAETSILVNRSSGSLTWILPDGTDGLVKEIVNGGPAGGAHESTDPLVVTSSNSAFGGNDALDLAPGESVRLVWNTALGGWCATSTCVNVNSLWD